VRYDVFQPTFVTNITLRELHWPTKWQIGGRSGFLYDA